MNEQLPVVKGKIIAVVYSNKTKKLDEDAVALANKVLTGIADKARLDTQKQIARKLVKAEICLISVEDKCSEDGCYEHWLSWLRKDD